MTRNKTGTVFIIVTLLTLMALGGLSRYWDGSGSDTSDWVTAGENLAKTPKNLD